MYSCRTPTGATGEGGAIRTGAAAAATGVGNTDRETTVTGAGAGASLRDISAKRASRTVATHPAIDQRLDQVFVVMKAFSFLGMRSTRSDPRFTGTAPPRSDNARCPRRARCDASRISAGKVATFYEIMLT